jgi:hypothetical protein
LPYPRWGRSRSWTLRNWLCHFRHTLESNSKNNEETQLELVLTWFVVREGPNVVQFFVIAVHVCEHSIPLPLFIMKILHNIVFMKNLHQVGFLREKSKWTFLSWSLQPW